MKEWKGQRDECHQLEKQLSAALLPLNPYTKFRESTLKEVGIVKSMRSNGRTEDEKERKESRKCYAVMPGTENVMPYDAAI